MPLRPIHDNEQRLISIKIWNGLRFDKAKMKKFNSFDILQKKIAKSTSLPNLREHSHPRVPTRSISHMHAPIKSC